jgi:lysozyme
MTAFARLLLPTLVLALLAACGGGSAPEQRAAGGSVIGPQSFDPVPGIPRPFGDADPTDWPRGQRPSDHPVHGVDVSKYQDAIDWSRAAQAGVRFAFLKATEGGDRLDPTFEDNWRQTRAAGIPRGAYHFYYFCRPAREQADWFIRNVPREAGALPPVLDMEWNHLSPTCTLRPPPGTVRAEAAVFLRDLTRHYGQRPIIYTTVDFWERNQMWRLEGYEFWLRSVARHPTDNYAGHHWTFWQYTGTGLVPGFRGRVDLNAYYGSASDWQSWLARRRQ